MADSAITLYTGETQPRAWPPTLPAGSGGISGAGVRRQQAGSSLTRGW
jgi:hypothetical protein